MDQPRHLTICVNEYERKEDEIDYRRLSYFLKLVNGEVTVRLTFYSDRDSFLLNVVYHKLLKKRV